MSLLDPKQLYDYQKEAVLHQLYHPKSMLWLDMGLGKLQSNSEPVLTPNGWIKMGDLKVGDSVIGSNGKPTKITGVFPQGEKEIVSVKFNDGSETRCGWEHLWAVRTAKQKQHNEPYKVMTMREIVDAGLYSGPNRKWSIPMVEPVQYTKKKLPIEPYLLGVILGDGSINKKGYLSLCTDKTIINDLELSVTSNHATTEWVGNCNTSEFCIELNSLNLNGKRSWEKHIPELYQRGSVDQRLALLQGLMDTDGSPIKCGGGLEYSTTSERLADGVVELTQSLGGVARKSSKRTTKHQNGDGRPSWRVNVKLPSQFTPFRLKRKLDNWIRPTKYQPARYIESVEVVGNEEATCIMVDAPDHLYVTKDHIVTHNTIVTLTSIEHRMREGAVKKTLIFGPVRVIHGVWERETRKWTHTRQLRCSVLSGTPDQRIKALFCDADIYLCSYENMSWLAKILNDYYIKEKRDFPFQFVVYDEVSKMKNPQTVRYNGGNRTKHDHHGREYKVKVHGWKEVADQFAFTTGLTGTPASNGYIDLFGQYLVVDGGERLGKFITHYRDNYFASDYMGWSYTPTEPGKKWIEHNISDITIKMDAKDYLDLPPVKTVNMFVELPKRAREHYKEMEAQMFTELDSGTEVEVFSKNSISNKCLQICNGAVYYKDEQERVHWDKVHDAKLDALEDVLEEAGGQPVLVAYNFKTDAERIMEKFKKYRPVNLTGEKASNTEKIINDWNAGKIKLLIGHPACLHPSTEVLTERRGWVKLIDVKPDERVHDGVEFVNHRGCSYSGYKEVINRFGITMTPDHKLLIDGHWVEAKDVDNTKRSREKAIFKWQETTDCLSSLSEVQHPVRVIETKRNKTQQEEKHVLYSLSTRPLSSSNRVKNLEDMVGVEEQVEGHDGPKLCWAWYKYVPGMGRLYSVLRRHGRWLRRQPNNRTDRQQQELQQAELPMGYQHGTAGEQTKQQVFNVSGSNNPSGRVSKKVGVQQTDVTNKTEQRIIGGRSCGKLHELSLREGHEAGKRETKTEKAHVYDLVDCGPRHRFLIRNENKEIFISHNSMGHGIDGLQQSGSIVVWYGVNWSLELYDQMNRRLDRNGQTRPVKIIRILCSDTVDLAVADAIARKTDTQTGLKDAIKRYRDGKVDKELKYDFMSAV